MLSWMTVEKDGAVYKCKPHKTGKAKCGKCLRGVLPFAEPAGYIRVSIGQECRVCGARIKEWGCSSLPDATDDFEFKVGFSGSKNR